MNTIRLGLLVAALTVAGSAAPAPDSLVAPTRPDTLTDIELRIYPPDGIKLPVSYQVDWGDGETLDWTDPIRSPMDISRYHRYRELGSYDARARLRDGAGSISEWGRALNIRVEDPPLKWVFPTFDPIVATPTLDSDGNVYIGDESGWIYCLDTKGQLIWGHETRGPVLASAAVGADGRRACFPLNLFRRSKPGRELVYFPSLDSHLYCFTTEGELVWDANLEDELYRAPAIGADGTVYVGTDAGWLVALDRNGKVLWRYDTGDEITASPSVGLDGRVYVTSDSIYCLEPGGDLLWSFGAEDEYDYFFPSAVPDRDGNVYAGNVDGHLYAVGPDGEMLWRKMSTDEEEIKPEVVFGPGGVIYVGNDGYYLCRLEPGGRMRDIFEADEVIATAAAVDADGNVFFVADDGYLFAMSLEGRMLWRQEIAVEMKDIFYTSSPAIGPDGTVYVSSWDGGVYAFRGFAPPARTDWPQYRHDAQHTGRLE